MITEVKNEEWRPVKGYEDFYSVSNFGRVKSLQRDNRYKKFGRIIPEVILRNQKHYRNGYMSVLLKIAPNQKRCTIHSLVANAFIINTEKLMEINHKDGNKENNHVSNLEWCTRSQNAIHKIVNGLCTTSKPVISVNQTAIIEFPSSSHCARYLNINLSWIIKRTDSGKYVAGHLIYSI